MPHAPAGCGGRSRRRRHAHHSESGKPNTATATPLNLHASAVRRSRRDSPRAAKCRSTRRWKKRLPMSELTSGTVTFLFTDIEGSTRLLDGHGEGYAALLTAHRRVLREAFDRHGGVEVDTQGDAFFVAFARATDALAAAEEAQRELELPVRIGIHTGEPQLVDGGYVGLDVHRAARICSAAHGRQVVVSQRTAELAEGEQLADLGLHRLKDLGEPIKLFQLGDEQFPPLRSLNATNLPAQPGPLVGREVELAELSELVGDERVVTLTGPGGSGKTRLALQVAAESVDDFVDGE